MLYLPFREVTPRGSTFEKWIIQNASQSAAGKGFLESAPLLTVLSGDVNATDYTALHRACFNKHSETVRLLLKAEGVDVNILDKDRNTALFYAVENNDGKIVSLLLTKAHDKEILEKVLQFAVKRKLTDMAKLLLQVPEVDVNAKGLLGDTILSVAVMDNRLEMVRVLLENRGKDFNEEDVQAALEMAEKFSHISPKIEQLLRKLLKGDTPEETTAHNVSSPPLAPRVSSGINMTGLLVKIALVAGLIITTALAAFAIQGILLPYSIIATASSGAMTLILGIYSLISKDDKQQSAAV